MNAIIIAAGSGERISNGTKNIPKSMVKVNGKPIIEYQLSVLKKAGINEVYVVTGPHSRKFNIKNDAVKGDDYGMLKEVLFRRFSKAVKEQSGSLSLPDLIMIDGGKGQYSVSREVLNELGLHDLPIIAIAKGKNRNAGEEKLYYQNKEFTFEKNDPLLFFIQRLRDEAHRFAISSHRAKRKKTFNKCY